MSKARLVITAVTVEKRPVGEVARSYGVACTPHAVVLDSDLAIVYTGRIDDSRTGDGPHSRELEAAIEDIAAGRPVSIGQTEAFGCSIIW